ARVAVQRPVVAPRPPRRFRASLALSAPMATELTTVADDLVVIHTADGDGVAVRRYEGLAPDTAFTFDGVEARTLPRPAGELLARLVTVNDVHFGEVEAGRVDDHPDGPILRAEPGGDPYPEVMN